MYVFMKEPIQYDCMCMAVINMTTTTEAFERRGGASQASVVRVPRAREVGQSYIC